jgi:hypothetical protein
MARSSGPFTTSSSHVCERPFLATRPRAAFDYAERLVFTKARGGRRRGGELVRDAPGTGAWNAPRSNCWAARRSRRPNPDDGGHQPDDVGEARDSGPRQLSSQLARLQLSEEAPQGSQQRPENKHVRGDAIVDRVHEAEPEQEGGQVRALASLAIVHDELLAARAVVEKSSWDEDALETVRHRLEAALAVSPRTGMAVRTAVGSLGELAAQIGAIQTSSSSLATLLR